MGAGVQTRKGVGLDFVPARGATTGSGPVEATPRLFYELDTSDPGAQSQGALVGAIIASGTGDILFISHESEKAFIASLKIR